MPVVADASVLIWLAKAGRLELLKDQYQLIIIPMEVYTEVVEQGLKENYPDAHVVKEAVEKGWIEVDSTKPDESHRRLSNNVREIHGGEAAVLILARAKGLTALMDESSGRTVAEALGLKTRGTLHVVLAAIHRRQITGDDARDTIASMIASGFRIEPRLLERVLREITMTPRKSDSR